MPDELLPRGFTDETIADLAAQPEDELDVEGLKALGVFDRVVAARSPASTEGGAPAAPAEAVAEVAGPSEAPAEVTPPAPAPVPPQVEAIPYPRFKQVNDEAKALRERTLQLEQLLAASAQANRDVLDLATKAVGGRQEPTAPPPPDPKAELAALNKSYEDGETTFADYMDRRDEMKARAAAAAAPPPPPPPPPLPPPQPTHRSLAMQQAGDALIAANPWVHSMEAYEVAGIAAIDGPANRLFHDKGYIADGSEYADHLFQQCIIEVAKKRGYDRLASQPASQPVSGPSGQPPLPAGAKKPLASSQPPDIASSMGAQGGANGSATDTERFGPMSAKDLAHLPASTLAALQKQYLQ